MPPPEIEPLGFIETSRVRFDRFVELLDWARGRGLRIDPDAAVHGVVRLPGGRWVRTDPAVSPLGAICMEMNPRDEDGVVRAAAAALLVSYPFAHGIDDGGRGRPNGLSLTDASYLRGLEFGYEVRAHLKRVR